MYHKRGRIDERSEPRDEGGHERGQDQKRKRETREDLGGEKEDVTAQEVEARSPGGGIGPEDIPYGSRN
ncbi:hypothetical protein CgunFtcFv8_018889 [Champsocephalus gunnari]|uniref:Uncharacterized protein n=1 Tax=Champsocephalus gunnari TaxID=52237 RepID=A0AAN8HMN6_CHAGU|nr:hypothetical protein CgunFtcFv8_018889 [Champsocephalus gunnari]